MGLLRAQFFSILLRVLREEARMSRFLASAQNLLSRRLKAKLFGEQATTDSLARASTSLQSVSARFYPFAEGADAWILPPPPPGRAHAPDAFAVPPQKLWAGYCDKADDYLASGKRDVEQMIELLKRAGCPIAAEEKDCRILDFGCAAGRMTRWLPGLAPRSEIWGADIRSEHILWCQQNLGPRLRFVTSTTFPHLPFEDRSFDLVYAWSVFTHIGELEDAWLLELRRILKPEGWAFLTVHDSSLMRFLRDCPPSSWIYNTSLRMTLIEHWKRMGLEEGSFGMLVVAGQPGNTQVFHDTGFLTQRWGQIVQIREIVPNGHGYQTAIIAQRP
jgi:SAM-dependent methyltransferase